jgi:hypothetical protein
MDENNETNLETNLENNQETEMIVVELEKKSKGRKKSQYSEKCSNCNRVYKTEKTYSDHVRKQICYTPLTTTYCKTCDLYLPTRLDYEKHLIKLEHIKTVQSKFTGVIEQIDIDPVPTINSADPYLDKQDINQLTKKTLGHNFTIHFNNNKTQSINLVSIKTTSEPVNSNLQSIEQHQQRNIEATSRQSKIIKFLESINDKSKCSTKLLEILDNKLHIDDYKNLQTLINQSENMLPDIKLLYIQTIEKFTMALIKLKSKGVEIYKEKDITKLVTNLTS